MMMLLMRMLITLPLPALTRGLDMKLTKVGCPICEACEIESESSA